MHKFSRQYSLPLVFTIYHFSTFFCAIKELFSQYTKIFTNKTKFEKFFFLIFLLSVLLKLFLNGVDKKSIIFICTFNTIFRWRKQKQSHDIKWGFNGRTVNPKYPHDVWCNGCFLKYTFDCENYMFSKITLIKQLTEKK